MDCGGSISNNPAGGHNVNAHLGAKVGDASANASAGVFAAGNTAGGPTTTGVYAAVNANGHGLSVQHANTPGFGTTTSEAARLNVFKNDNNAFDANAFHSRTHMENGLKFDKAGAGMSWNSAQGHSASLGASHIPQFNITTMDAAAKANLWTSPNGASAFDANANASRHLSGPFAGKNNFGGGFGFTHRF